MSDLSPWAILAGVIAPAIFWIAFLYYKDRLKPEPFPLMLTAYGLGVVAGFIALNLFDLLLYLGLPDGNLIFEHGNWWQSLVYCVVAIGLLEEVVKFLPFWLFCLRFEAFDEEIDGIVYASSVALGFATFENVLHFQHLEGPELYARAYVSPLVHTIFASIWGHACAKVRLGGGSMLRAALVSLVIAAVIHGLYDFLALSPGLGVLAALVILVVWLWRMRVIHKLQAKWRKKHGDGNAEPAEKSETPED